MERFTLHANSIEFACRALGEGDRVVLLLHGFPDDAGSMDGMAAALAAAGYRAVAPYMRGYGASVLPPGASTHIADLAADVVALAAALGGRRTYVFGHDWGAVAAYAATNLNPQAFAAIVAAAVPPPRAFLRALRLRTQRRRSWYMAYFQIPILAERRLRAQNFALVERLWRDWSPGWEVPQERLAAVKASLSTPAATTAALGYYRAMGQGLVVRPAATWRSARLALAPLTVPTLVLAGAHDGCIGAEAFTHIGDSFAGAYDLAIVPGAGHFLHLEQPDEVAARVLEFFSVY